MSSVPMLSIVIPTFNRAYCLERCVSSVYAQQIADFEVLIVDDGSTDDTAVVVRKLDFPNLRYFRKENGGASSARNYGIEHAHGEFIVFIDSDDYFMPGYLTEAIKLADKQTCVYAQVICKRSSQISYLRPSREISPDERMDEYLICAKGFVTPNGLIIPNQLKTPRFCTELTNGDDMDFAIQLAAAGYRFVMSPIPSSVWEDEFREDRLSNRQNYAEIIAWADKHRSYLSDRAYFGVIGWHAARGMANSGLRMQAMHWYLKALTKGSYTLKLAIIVCLQIMIPRKQYRVFSDWLAKFGVRP
jgi:glycosyltransferase involved in cell wall biosynthesis